MADTTKTPAQVLFTGNDGRVSAIRNNLVRKNAQVVEAVGKLSDAEITKLNEFCDPDEIVRAAQDYRKAVKERLAAVKTAARTAA